MIYCEPELKEQIIKLYIQEGRTYQSLSDEFGFSTDVIRRWVKSIGKAHKRMLKEPGSWKKWKNSDDCKRKSKS